MKHKYHKEIIAWANGAEIEFSYDGVRWKFVKNPRWFDKCQYRVKKSPRTFWLNVYDGHSGYLYHNQIAAESMCRGDGETIKVIEVIE